LTVIILLPRTVLAFLIIIPLLPVFAAAAVFLFLSMIKMASGSPSAATACSPQHSPQYSDVSDAGSEAGDSVIHIDDNAVVTLNASTDTAGSLSISSNYMNRFCDSIQYSVFLHFIV
jgi:hypothetical protein